LYFFTLVTYKRYIIFETDKIVGILKSAIKEIRKSDPFDIGAIVILPEHLHLMMQLPEGDANYSARISKIKKNFGKQYIEKNLSNQFLTDSASKRNERGIWQRRFWEHRIKSYEDYVAHLNYIHYNPVKHKLVQGVADWKWSTSHRFLKNGFYDIDWGKIAPNDISGAEWD
jgi:putative transposase